MWTLFPDFVRNYYEACESVHSNFPSGKEELDPITCAGQANMGLLLLTARRLNLGFAIFAICTVVNLQDFLANCLLPEKKRTFVRNKKTDPKWLDHIEILSHAPVTGIAKECCLKDVQVIGSYFEVFKGLTGFTRSIFDGRLISSCCRIPPPVNLCEIREQLKLIDLHQCFNMVTCDLRHWFHQLPLGVELRRFFGLRIVVDTVSRFFTWVTVPMGWSWSPYIAQSVAWTLMLSTGLFDPLPPSTSTAMTPPRFLVKTVNGEVIMVAFLLYDNVLVAARHESQAEQFVAAFAAQLKHHNVEPKHISFFSRKSLLAEEWNDEDSESLTGEVNKPRCIHLGIQLGMTHGGKVRWRHDPDKVRKWRELVLPLLSASMTLRVMAKFIGIILWNNTVAMQGLLSVEEVLNVASIVGKEASGKKWDNVHSCTKKEEEILRSNFNAILLNGVHTLVAETTLLRRVYFASDASTKFNRWGAVELSLGETKVIGDPVGFEFGPVITDQHIFLKELYGAIWTLKYAAKKYGPRTSYYLVIDNTAAAAVLRRGYSSSSYANNLLRELPDFVLPHLTIVTVLSANNPADAPSRQGVPTCKKKKKLWWKAVDSAIASIRRHQDGLGLEYDVVSEDRKPKYGGVRHQEEDEVKDISRLNEPVDSFWSVALAPEILEFRCESQEGSL